MTCPMPDCFNLAGGDIYISDLNSVPLLVDAYDFNGSCCNLHLELLAEVGNAPRSSEVVILAQ